jgi:CRP-like cAMP-binding protein
MAGHVNRTTSDKVAVLRKADLFAHLTDDLLRKIAGLAVTRTLIANQLLYSEHDEASALFVVARGELRSIRQNLEGREQVLSTERPGAILAAVPVFNGGKFYSTVIADVPSEVLSLEKHQVHQLCHEHDELLWNLARVLAHKVRHYAELIESLALRNVEQRVAQHLLTIARERGVPFGDGSIVELTLTRTQMASRIGSAREVVSRALTHLHKSSLIHIEGRRLVTVPNLQALNTFAGTIRHAEPAKLSSDLSSDLA